MGKRGPAPEPTKIKELRGNPGKRALPAKEPEPAGGAPPAPEWLDDIARAEWARVVPALDAVGLLSQVDQATLGAYCQAVSDYVQAVENVRKEGQLFRTPQGFVAKNPRVTILNEARKALLQFAGQFGLTPSARTRLAMEDAGGDDDFAKWSRKA